MLVLAMASILSLPRLPLASASTSPAHSSRFASSQSGVCSSRHSIGCPAALERTSLSCTAVDAGTSWIAFGRNVGPEAQVGPSRSPAWCFSGEDQDPCTTSCDGILDALVTPGRREVLSATLGAAVLGIFWDVGEAMARDRRNKKEIAAADYLTSGKSSCAIFF